MLKGYCANLVICLQIVAKCHSFLLVARYKIHILKLLPKLIHALNKLKKNSSILTDKDEPAFIRKHGKIKVIVNKKNAGEPATDTKSSKT